MIKSDYEVTNWHNYFNEKFAAYKSNDEKGQWILRKQNEKIKGDFQYL